MTQKKTFVEPTLQEEFSLAVGTLGAQLASGSESKSPEFN